MLCNDVHGDLCEEHIGSDSRSRRDPGLKQHLPDHGHCQFMRRHAVGLKIFRHVHEALIDGIDVDIVCADVFGVYGEDLCGDLLVKQHLRRGNNI